MTNQVGNKNIDNASGQVVRLDIQNTIQAVAANNFGPRVQAGTILPAELLADSTTGKLLIRKTSGGDQANPNPPSGTAADFFPVGNLDEDNLGLIKREGDTLTGPLLVDDSSGASTPAIAFDGDPDTGIYRSGPNSMGFATAGVQRVGISDSGLDMSNGLPIRFQDSSGAPFVALKSASSLSNNRTFTLPATTGTSGQFLAVSASNHSATNAELEFATVSAVPTGAIFALPDTQAGGTTGYQANGVPTGYKECNGDAISRTTFAALFAVIGTKYGVGDGSNTFNLPDLRGEFIRGWASNTTDSSRDQGRQIGSNQGGQNQQHSHTADAVAQSTVTDPGHDHPARGHGSDDDGGDQFAGSGNNSVRNNAIDDATTGISVGTNVNVTVANQGGESRPRNIAMMYIIKT